jgi:3-phenylpropionate/cinnamic acid dioxygenase small subunit
VVLKKQEGWAATLCVALALTGTALAAAPRLDVAATTRALKDRAEIDDLMVAYMDVLDAGDYAAYAALFTEQGAISYGNHNLVGRKQIHDVVKTELEGLRNPTGSDGLKLTSVGMHHLLLNPIIRVGGDRASATATWIFVKVTPDGKTELWGAGRYVDSFVRTKAGWLFASRIVTDTVADTIARNAVGAR